MPFLGKSSGPRTKNNNILLDAITASATATYNLTRDSAPYVPAGATSLQVSLNGVTQAPVSGYGVTGSQLIFDAALTTNDVIDYVVAYEGLTSTVAVADGGITTTKLANNSVDSDKYVDESIDTVHIADDQITGAKLANSVDVNTGLTIGGASNGVAITNGQIALKNSGAVSKLDFYCEVSNAHYTRLQSAPHGSYSGNVVLTLPASDGDALQFLQTNGSGVTSWATVSVPASVYAAWAIITSVTNLVSGGQYISNSSGTLTHTLPAGSAGSSITIKNNGSGLVTLARTNNEKIGGATANATMPQNHAAQLIYVDSTTGWLVL